MFNKTGEESKEHNNVIVDLSAIASPQQYSLEPWS
jgi:hypothetical protein